MILLEPQSTIIQTTLTEKFSSANLANPKAFDVQFVDYDGVRFHLSSPESKTLVLLSMSVRCWDELATFGANDVIHREYKEYVAPSVEPDYNVSLQFNLEQLPASEEERQALIQSVALIKRNALAAPFELAFKHQKELEATPAPTDGSQPPIGKLIQIRYRDEEAIYIQAAADRVTVIFSTIFQEEVDRVYAKKVFLQEFVDARRLPALQEAPQVLYSIRDPPLELRQVPGLRLVDEVGYVTFVLFPRHFSPETITHIQLFRDYLHYHIKCSKAYMHSRMRFRVKEFQKILNRAKMEEEQTGEKERKTVSGRTMISR